MTLSFVLLFALPLFLVPSILLPANRLKVYDLSAFLAFLPIALTMLVEAVLPSLGVFSVLADRFRPFYSFLLTDGMTAREESVVGSMVLFLYVYLALYLLVYLIQKVFFLGKNVTIHWTGKALSHLFYSTVFFLCTYVPFFLLLVGIRQVFPFGDGFLGGFFQLLNPLEA